MSETEPVHYAVADGVATITIDRPERKNALSVEAMNGLDLSAHLAIGTCFLM